MPKKPILFKVDEKVAEDWKSACEERGLKLSKRAELLLKADYKKLLEEIR